MLYGKCTIQLSETKNIDMRTLIMSTTTDSIYQIHGDKSLIDMNGKH